MEAHYKDLWSIVVKDEKLGEMFATYDSCGIPPIDRNRTVFCGEERLAQKILERGEYFPRKGAARVVPVTVEVKERLPK